MASLVAICIVPWARSPPLGGHTPVGKTATDVQDVGVVYGLRHVSAVFAAMRSDEFFMQMNACTTAALRILATCAHEVETSLTMPDMAASLGIGEPLVVKACHRLMRAGYLLGTRGRGGGYRLARPAAAITLFEIVRLFENEDDLFPCRLKVEGPCCIAPVCRLRDVCSEAWIAYADVLSATTIADVADAPLVRALPA